MNDIQSSSAELVTVVSRVSTINLSGSEYTTAGISQKYIKYYLAVQLRMSKRNPGLDATTLHNLVSAHAVGYTLSYFGKKPGVQRKVKKVLRSLGANV